MKRAIVIVDHGSRHPGANAVVAELARAVQIHAGDRAEVCFAHLEAAEPRFERALDECVRQGAREVLVQPLFLVPGRHAARDIPELIDAARQRHPGIRFRLGEVIGADPLLAQLLFARAELALEGPS
jgi:sirohydrochlorin ferrochelatase